MESFCRIQLLPNMELGEWQVRIHSGQKYTVKITGQSMVDFSYYFAEKFSGPHPGFAELNGRPATGRNVSMVFSITGLTLYKSFSFTDVFFMDALGRILQTTSLQTTGTADTFLVNESSAFEPGKEHAVFFNLENNGPPMTFHIRVWNDQNYTMSSNLSSVDLGFNATKQGSLILLAPSGTESGTIVTLSIEAESSDQSDFNFALVQLTVAEKVEDFSAPKCSIIAMNKNCATHCSIQQWHLTVEFQETGTGIERIYVRYGNGTLITKEATVMGTSVTQVNYTASCCTQDVEIIGVDKVGNVGKCFTAEETMEREGLYSYLMEEGASPQMGVSTSTRHLNQNEADSERMELDKLASAAVEPQATTPVREYLPRNTDLDEEEMQEDTDSEEEDMDTIPKVVVTKRRLSLEDSGYSVMFSLGYYQEKEVPHMLEESLL
nr:PREDICTED: uncharacterized protein LOC102364600 [Latimeria chalumnae]|eukprot:XP_014354546.1 PREDICTED: uncharacterized protein LOC102364600 [Latimeria chalumnae]